MLAAGARDVSPAARTESNLGLYGLPTLDWEPPGLGPDFGQLYILALCPGHLGTTAFQRLFPPPRKWS